MEGIFEQLRKAVRASRICLPAINRNNVSAVGLRVELSNVHSSNECNQLQMNVGVKALLEGKEHDALGMVIPCAAR